MASFGLRISLLVFIVSFLSVTNADRAPTRLIFEYPHKGTWFENAAVRRNGSILLTSLNFPGGLHSLNPFEPHPTPILVMSDFDHLNSTLGIVETALDTFFVIAANFSLSLATLGTQTGTNAIYKVVLTDEYNAGKATPSVSLLAKLTDAETLNGLSKFNDTLLLAADSGKGAVWAINTETGAAKIVAQDPLMAPKPVDGFGEGINGVHFRDGAIYFTNSQQYIFAKASLDANAQQKGPAVKIADAKAEEGLKPNIDDFAIDKSLTYAYVATERGNSIQRIKLSDGTTTVFAGGVNSTAIAAPAAARFGRTTQDSDVLYAVTNGGFAFPVQTAHGSRQFGAQVVAVKIGG